MGWDRAVSVLGAQPLRFLSCQGRRVMSTAQPQDTATVQGGTWTPLLRTSRCCGANCSSTHQCLCPFLCSGKHFLVFGWFLCIRFWTECFYWICLTWLLIYYHVIVSCWFILIVGKVFVLSWWVWTVLYFMSDKKMDDWLLTKKMTKTKNIIHQ